jgi:LPS sulfotransferase NodH
MLLLKTDLETGIARHDFCGAQFDNPVPVTTPPRALYVLVSTPRSGSTWLCSEIYRRSGLLAHEYLQHYQYLPQLASRFGVAHENHVARGTTIDINLSDYYEALVRWRSHHGVLGINAHVGHLPALQAFLAVFRQRNPDSEIVIDHLSRHDKYRQAASLAIARRNRQWSKTGDVPAPADEGLPGSWQQWLLLLDAAKAYRQILRQDRAMMAERGALEPQRILAYEDLLRGGMDDYITTLMARLKLPAAERRSSPPVALQQQSGPLNAALAGRLRRWQPLLGVASRIAAPIRSLSDGRRRGLRKRPRQQLRLLC